MKINMKIKTIQLCSLLILLFAQNIHSVDAMPYNGPLNENDFNASTSTSNNFSSFLTVSESLETKTAELAELSSATMLKAMMMAKSGNRSKKRYTEDGRLCSSAFAQDGQTFFDCTASRAPDGQNKNKEWCYVDASAKGDKPWDYCKPIMDYDKIREQNQEQLKQFTVKARETHAGIEANIEPSQQALDDLKRVRKGQAELDQKINQLIGEISTLNNNMQNLYNTKEQWEKEEDNSVLIATKIEERINKQKEEDSMHKPIDMDKSEGTVKKEMADTKVSIAPHIQQRRISSSANCEGMLLYEEESRGDGILGEYFDNESFLGEYKEQKEVNIDFDWTGASPAEGINASNFSVKWEGFIRAPVTSNYQFAIECDDGASVTINNQIVVSHNMYGASEESKSRVDKWLTQEADKMKNPSKNFNKSTSIPIKLTGGDKFKIVVSYYHSVHDDVQDNDKAFIKLYWQSDEFEERIVSRNYLYTQNSFAPLKLSGFSADTAVIRKLHENDLAFKNSDEYILKDIPTDYQGLTALKLNIKLLDRALKFASNIPVIVYMGYVAHYPNPIPTDFENTGEHMSILQVNKPSSGSSGSSTKNLQSTRSALIKVYKKKFEAGKISIPLNQKSINIKGIPLVVFFGFDSQNASPVSCGGSEIWISDPNSKHIKRCKESSSINSNWSCRNGLNGRNKDTEGSMWATKSEGVGSWLNVDFRNLYQVSRIKYFNRANPAERNYIIIATFSSGEEFEMKLRNINEPQEFIIDPQINTSSLKFTIKNVFGTINNGGSFQIYGTQCIDAEELDKGDSPEARGLEKISGVNPRSLPALFKLEDSKPITLSCKDSLSNSKKLAHIKQKPGSKSIVRCTESCADSKAPLYGDIQYSKDSSICKAAYHSQKLNSEGGIVTIIFHPGQSSYKSQMRNGMKSKSKGRSDITITFDSAEEQEDIILQNGSKVDVKSNGKWQPGIITQIKESDFSKILLINVEGSGSNSIQTTYPNKNVVKPCGDKIRNRDCKGSRLKQNTNRPIKVKFAPSTFNTPGDFLQDKGEIFGKSGKAFGWSKDISNRVRTRMGGNKPELDTLVEFPPSPKSKFCNKQNPDVLCDKVTWSFKAGHGRFNVKLYVGDPQANTRIDLKVNDNYLVEGETISKGELKIYEGAFETINQYITISSDCRNDCEYAMSKLNMVEVYPFQEDENKEEEPTAEQQDPCGTSSTGGRCDTGPDVTHCIFEDPTAEGAKFCTGNLLMVQVTKQYRCTSQRDKFKCVKRTYANSTECLVYCPGKCEKNMCL